MSAIQFVFYIVQQVGVFSPATYEKLLQQADDWFEGNSFAQKYLGQWYVTFALGILAPLAQRFFTKFYNSIIDQDGDGDVDIYDLLLQKLKERQDRKAAEV